MPSVVRCFGEDGFDCGFECAGAELALDRLVRVARILASAEKTLGGLEKAALWLRRPNRALGGEVPLSLLDTEVGEQLVEDALK